MTKTLSLTLSFAVAVLGLAAVTAPSQAATRLMSSSLDAFEFRCSNHGGSFSQDGATVSCQTPSIPVACEYFSATQANCAWNGNERHVDVIRVIGTLPVAPAAASSSGSGGGVPNGNGGGGFQGPNDLKQAPNNEPKPNFNGPKDFQMAP